MMQAMPKAMVLAAGLGTRMRPLTDRLPKPLVKVAGVTLIDRALDWLSAAGVTETVVNTHYHTKLLEAHLAKRIAPKIQISYEETVLETGGGIKQALPLLTSPSPLVGEGRDGGNLSTNSMLSMRNHSPLPRVKPGAGSNPPPQGGRELFIAVNSDVICIDGRTPALHRLLQAWDDDVDALLLVNKVADAVGYDGAGDFFMGEGGSLRRRFDAPSAPYVFTGVQILHPRLFHHSPDGAFSLNVLYNRDMKKDGTLQHVRGLIHDGAWLHVGTPQELQLAERWLATHR